ncbi:uncharacterized protein ACLA_010680 [Aspergillus clavatus NRRL 1]|uniref:Uncharacterized protein n=1 Tax=Aspergillus clavatus (strain ATCC 1007 / CBS 513.65 / DSM 816 / NCTC 3887 / NRRL 1 / QM 1276 / 107) TaxID=344612 RepID=A1CA74_ASPCL|nr:uncharacterized protein ACLA_010680 [Aspergillus clavatus NRRL 1]EAW12642.1 hypothetical protein ACLA_010680 [Aspergillus clavatus NRRL 1]
MGPRRPTVRSTSKPRAVKTGGIRKSRFTVSPHNPVPRKPLEDVHGHPPAWAEVRILSDDPNWTLTDSILSAVQSYVMLFRGSEPFKAVLIIAIISAGAFSSTLTAASGLILMRRLSSPECKWLSQCEILTGLYLKIVEEVAVPKIQRAISSS